jgi:biotin carboxyl carrier protein
VHAVVDGRRYVLSVTEPQARVYSILKDGVSHEAIVELRPGAARVRLGRTFFEVHQDQPVSGRAGGAARGGQTSGRLTLTAVMPGRVVRVEVNEGDAVAARQGLLVLEAMKMENELAAPRDGTVSRVLVKPGATVEAGDPLVILE